MALYAYQALSKEGKRLTGQVDAASIAGARDILISRNLYPTKIELVKESVYSSILDYFRSSIDIKEKLFFSKQLAVLLKSGVPLLQALELLIEQSEGKLKAIIIDLKDTVKEGQSLADGLAKYPKVFDNIYVQLVKAGEASGRLELILDRLTTYLERKEFLQKKIKGALSYPLIQLAIVFAVTVFLLYFVVPQLAETLQSTGGELPLPTRILLVISGFITNHYLLIIGVIIALIILYRIWSATASGARTIDQIKLRIPIVSYFARMGAVVQFSRTLGVLLEGGVNIAESLFIVTKIVDNRILTDALTQARDKIIKQGKIAEYLRQTRIFPPVAIYLINTGEQSGHLDSMLTTVAEYYEAELNDYSDSLTSKITPITIIIMGAIVAFILFSILLPIIQTTANLQNM